MKNNEKKFKITTWLRNQLNVFVMRILRLDADDVQWVVNDNAELGVRVVGKFFWLYKGESIVYKDGKHDNGMSMYWRNVGKREFGECCYPIHLEYLPDQYREGDGWKQLSSA